MRLSNLPSNLGRAASIPSIIFLHLSSVFYFDRNLLTFTNQRSSLGCWQVASKHVMAGGNRRTRTAPALVFAALQTVRRIQSGAEASVSPQTVSSLQARAGVLLPLNAPRCRSAAYSPAQADRQALVCQEAAMARSSFSTGKAPFHGSICHTNTRLFAWAGKVLPGMCHGQLCLSAESCLAKISAMQSIWQHARVRSLPYTEHDRRILGLEHSRGAGLSVAADSAWLCRYCSM